MQYLVDIRKFQNIEKDKDLMLEISYTYTDAEHKSRSHYAMRAGSLQYIFMFSQPFAIETSCL